MLVFVLTIGKYYTYYCISLKLLQWSFSSVTRILLLNKTLILLLNKYILFIRIYLHIGPYVIRRILLDFKILFIEQTNFF